MTHLLLLHLGPVQDFIAQARRTRDLWLGSFLLSELAKAAALALAEGGAELIFPALESADLRPCRGPFEADRPAQGVANRVIALIEEADPASAARAARDAAQAELQRRWDQVRRDCEELFDPEATAAAQEQIETLLDIHAAWAHYHDRAGYARALQQAEADLAARKTLRPFGPWMAQQRGVHKSSLDGGRETVLHRGDRNGKPWRDLRVGLREELDAIGLLKRASGKPGQFVPVPTIGLAAWIEAAKEHAPRQLEDLRRACEARKFTPVHRPDLHWLRPFPFDAQILLPNRWWPYLQEIGQLDPEGRDPRAARAEAQAFGESHVRPLLQVLGDPHPYVACLAADGDRMGETLRFLARGGAERHGHFSQALACFAARARLIIERRRGVLVYAGGDDVLAFVALPDAFDCAEELRAAFVEHVARSLAYLGDDPAVPRPTLSVGLGIGHILESLGHLLDLGREAERIAKGDALLDPAQRRDALAIFVEKRGGQRLTARARWGDALPAQLTRDQERLAAGLPLGKVYEVAGLLQRLRHLLEPAAAPAPGLGALLDGEVRRILARAESGREPRGLTPADVGLSFDRTDPLAARAAIHAWTERVQIAAFFAAARPRRPGEPAPYARETR